jgi:hypothetical protein
MPISSIALDNSGSQTGSVKKSDQNHLPSEPSASALFDQFPWSVMAGELIHELVRKQLREASHRVNAGYPLNNKRSGGIRSSARCWSSTETPPDPIGRGSSRQRRHQQGPLDGAAREGKCDSRAPAKICTDKRHLSIIERIVTHSSVRPKAEENVPVVRYGLSGRCGFAAAPTQYLSELSNCAFDATPFKFKSDQSSSEIPVGELELRHV